MIYLDNAATTYPKPEEVMREIAHCMTECGGNPGRGGHRLSLAAAEVVYNTRCVLTEYLSAERPEQFIFTLNATYAINLILRARVRQGDHILISDMEHNAVYRPVVGLADAGVATFSVFSHRGSVLDNIRRILKKETRILVCTHISNVNGYVFPVAEIARFCRAHNVYMILDASQSVGHRPLSVSDICCDALCAPGHKGLFGMQGSGFLYLRDPGGLSPVFSGGSGAHSLSPHMPDDLPERFEPGTLPTPAIATIKTGIDWICRRDTGSLEAGERAFSHRLHELLGNLRGVTLFSIPDTGITAFTIRGMPSDTVANRLDDAGICVRGGYHCAPLAHAALSTVDGGVVRVSASAMNRVEDAEAVAVAVRKMI